MLPGFSSHLKPWSQTSLQQVAPVGTGKWFRTKNFSLGVRYSCLASWDLVQILLQRPMGDHKHHSPTLNLPRCKGHSALKGLAAWTTSSGSRLGSVWYGSKGGGKFLYSCSPQNTWQKAANGWFRISRFWAAWRCEHMFAITIAQACSMHEYHQSSSIPCLLMIC